MKICITSEGKTLDSKIDLRFGRRHYFIIIDTDTLNFENIKNPNIESTGGAGIKSAQLVASKQIKAVVTGNVGPNAFKTLQAAGIEVIFSTSGTVKEAIEKYRKGEFKSASNPSVTSHFGMRRLQCALP